MWNTHVAASDTPLLLSRKSMKKVDKTLDFKNDNAVIFRKAIQLIATKSGHCGFLFDHIAQYYTMSLQG